MLFHARTYGCICLLIFLGLAGSCQSVRPGNDVGSSSSPSPAKKGTPVATPAPQASKPVAYVRGEAIRREALSEPLMEAAGGEVFAELVLDRLINDELEQAGLTLTEQDLQAERQRVLNTLADDKNEAARLLRELRQRRGLGKVRFEHMLRRNAGLRKLVADQVTVSEAAIQQEFRRRYGEKYRARILVVPSLQKASKLRDRLLAGDASFSDLAAMHSTDASADRGGLLSPISPADPSYPQSIREALQRLAKRPSANSPGDCTSFRPSFRPEFQPSRQPTRRASHRQTHQRSHRAGRPVRPDPA